VIFATRRGAVCTARRDRQCAQKPIIGAALSDPHEISRSDFNTAGPAAHTALRAISPSSHAIVQSLPFAQSWRT
jgi:hypothetical protein